MAGSPAELLSSVTAIRGYRAGFQDELRRQFLVEALLHSRAVSPAAHATLPGVTRIFSAKVIDGVIVAPDVELPEGAEVTVCLSDELPMTVSPEDEARLLASIEQADRGLGIPAENALAAAFRH